MFEGASTISDDAYVAIHPAEFNNSILKFGLSPERADSAYVYVTQMRYFRDLGLEEAADNVAVDATKWLSQPVTLWEVKPESVANLQPYFGPGLGPAPQWVSSVPLDVIPHMP
jgi:hypothetical protein